MKVAEVCARVSKAGSSWSFASGTLPERGSGATGKGGIACEPDLGLHLFAAEVTGIWNPGSIFTMSGIV
jgi:hypothetical protein